MNTPSIKSQPTSSISLRDLASRAGILIGTAVNTRALSDDPTYKQVLARNFNEITPENVMKFGPIHPERNRYDFLAADQLVEFAETNQMQVRGHTLVWHNQNPAWLTEGKFSREELIEILKEHITTVVGRYRGKVAAWDVVNEAINDDGTPRETLWSKGIGPGYIEMALRWAHAADPNALLFYNDYNAEGLGRKSDAVYALAQDLIKRGVPLDGIGLQMHATLGGAPSPKDLQANLQRLGKLGLTVHITELDIRLPMPASPAALAQQAVQYRTYLEICLKEANCKAFVLWGFSDRYSWIPGFFKGYGAALIFDESFQPKPAYQSLIEKLSQSNP